MASRPPANNPRPQWRAIAARSGRERIDELRARPRCERRVHERHEVRMGTGHATWAGHGGLRSGIGTARIVRLARIHGNAPRAAELHRALDAALCAEPLHEPFRHIPPLGGILHRHVFHGKPFPAVPGRVVRSPSAQTVRYCEHYDTGRALILFAYPHSLQASGGKRAPRP